MTVSGEEATESVSSLNMLCSLWDSVKDLIMTCATTKIKVINYQCVLAKLIACFLEIICGMAECVFSFPGWAAVIWCLYSAIINI